jgi:hypothetical protein
METTVYEITTLDGVVLDTATSEGQAAYMYDKHIFGYRALRILPVTVWAGPCGCMVCEKWADCDYCEGCTPSQPACNLVEIVRGVEGFDVTVSMANGFAESIQGLYDVTTALDYGHMHVNYQTNKYL